jgi:uncharacterized integral membrane protein
MEARMNDQKILAVLAGIVLPVVGLHAGAFFGAVILWNHAETDFPLFEVGGGALLGALLGFILAVFAIKNLFPPAMKVYLVTVGWLPLVLALGILGFFIVGQIHFSIIGYKILAERVETNTYPITSGGEIFDLAGFIGGCVLGFIVHIVLAVRLWPRRKVEAVAEV